jgi:MoxR-like ATPase
MPSSGLRRRPCTLRSWPCSPTATPARARPSRLAGRCPRARWSTSSSATPPTASPPSSWGERAFVERCVVALATNRGLMLIGRAGTAKSYLSELLAAAVSGDSTLTVQGSASTTDDAIKYSWNYALLLDRGPSLEALVPAPVHRGMSEGKVVRFEEITRCPIEVQDSLLSILSDRVLTVPELSGPDRVLHARKGFSVIATANTRDRGVNEMSAALKRRFNFETVRPIRDHAREVALGAAAVGRRPRRRRTGGAGPRRPDRRAGHGVPRAAHRPLRRRHSRWSSSRPPCRPRRRCRSR